MAKVFVTGATGFIGTKLVNQLVERGHSVHALSRSTSNREGLANEGIRIVQGDITEVDSLKRGMAGCTQVYHLAAYAKNWSKDKSIFFRQNVEGMRNVFAAARSVAAKRLVFTSTIVTFGPTRSNEVGNEEMPRITPEFFTEYEETKTIAEREALKAAREGFPVVIVNPTRVYGPGKMTEGNSVTRMIDQYDRGLVPVLLNRGVNIGNYVLVDDLVRGHILAMEKGRIGERYIIGSENISLKEFYKLVDQASGRKHFQFNLPPRLGLLYGEIQRLAAESLGLYPQVTTGWVKTFLQDWAYSCSKAERELGYSFTPLAEGVRRTYEWILEERKRRRQLK
jgi:farnesol dehydrogenase